MKRWLMGIVGVPASLFSEPYAAAAADMALKASPAPAQCQWCGWYFGGNIGGKWADTSASAFLSAPSGFELIFPAGTLPFGSTTAATFMGGGQLGYAWQSGPVVFGIEGDIDAQHWSTTRTAGAPPLPGLFVPGDNFTVSSNWQASLRGRLGYAWDRMLFYATGGVAWTRVSVATNFVTFGIFPASSATDNETRTGGTVGGGIEYALTNNVSLGVEGRYTWYGSHTYNGGTVAAVALGPAGPPFVFSSATQTLSLNSAELMGKINIRLGWPGFFGPTR